MLKLHKTRPAIAMTAAHPRSRQRCCRHHRRCGHADGSNCSGWAYGNGGASAWKEFARITVINGAASANSVAEAPAVATDVRLYLKIVTQCNGAWYTLYLPSVHAWPTSAGVTNANNPWKPGSGCSYYAAAWMTESGNASAWATTNWQS